MGSVAYGSCPTARDDRRDLKTDRDAIHHLLKGHAISGEIEYAGVHRRAVGSCHMPT